MSAVHQPTAWPWGLAIIMAAAISFATPAAATPVTFFGLDQNITNVSAPLPNSFAARGQFNAAVGAGGKATITDDLEGLPLVSPDNGTRVDLGAGIGVSLQGTSSAIVAGNTFGTGVRSDLNPLTAANPGFGFNTTVGGAQFFRIVTGLVDPGAQTHASAAFDFATPTDAFGLMLTGLGTGDGSLATLRFVDGSTQTLVIPGGAVVGGTNSVAEFFGFLDAGASISAVTFDLQFVNIFPTPQQYLLGFDDVTVSASVPEPGTLILLAIGAIAAVRRVRRSASGRPGSAHASHAPRA